MSGRLGRRLAAALVTACLFALGFFSVPTTTGRAAGGGAALGVYRGAAAPSDVSAFGTWLGRSPSYALDFFAGSTWSDIESPDWWLSGWAGSPYTVVYSVPIIPGSGGTLEEGASGAFDAHFTRLAQDLVAHGDGNAILRLGWEFNGNWFRWSAQADPAAFATYWRHIVTAMRAVAPSLRFDWSITLGSGIPGGDEAAYPGDAYVDYVGADVYDQAWGPNNSIVSDPATRWNMYVTESNGLNWLSSFAATHGKQISIPEWGLTIRGDGHGGGDNAYFVQQMYNWITSHNVAYASYFEYDASDGVHRLMTNEFPIGAATYRQLFGPTTTSTSTSSTTSAGTTAPPPSSTTGSTTTASTTTAVPPATTTASTTTTTTATTPKKSPKKCTSNRCLAEHAGAASARRAAKRESRCLRYVVTSRPPSWFWVWVRWELGRGEFKGHGSAPAYRPRGVPKVIPAEAWSAFRRFVRGERVAAGFCAG